MKKFFPLIGLVLATSVIHAADTNSSFASRVSISPFAGVNADKFKPTDGDAFAGLSAAFAITDVISISAEGAARNTHERFVDQFGAHLVGYVPLGKTGLLGCGELGWQQFTGDDRHNFQSTGVGVVVRGKRVEGFVKARWLQDFSVVGHAQYLLGLNLRF